MSNNPKNPKRLLRDIVSNNNENVDFDIDNWSQDFEHGFPRFTKINPEYKDNFWGQGQGNRPRLKELNEEADAQKIEGYRVVEFFPDRDNNSESYLLLGTPSEIKIQVSLMMNLRIMMLNLLAELEQDRKTEYLRLQPRTDISVQLILTSRKTPPFRGGTKKYYTQRQVTIPCVKEEMLTYAKLREVCGGDAGQSWGNWSARAYLRDTTSGGIRQMVSGGSSKAKALAHLKGYLELTKCQVLKITTHEEQFTEGELASLPNKTQYLKFDVYPSWMNVKNNKMIKLNERPNSGRKTLSGRLLQVKEKLFLWMENEPSWWQPSLRKILKEKFIEKE